MKVDGKYNPHLWSFRPTQYRFIWTYLNEILSLRLIWDSIRGLCQESVYIEKRVNPSSMDGVPDFYDHNSFRLIWTKVYVGCRTWSCQFEIWNSSVNYSVMYYYVFCLFVGGGQHVTSQNCASPNSATARVVSKLCPTYSPFLAQFPSLVPPSIITLATAIIKCRQRALLPPPQ